MCVCVCCATSRTHNAGTHHCQTARRSGGTLCIKRQCPSVQKFVARTLKVWSEDYSASILAGRWQISHHLTYKLSTMDEFSKDTIQEEGSLVGSASTTCHHLLAPHRRRKSKRGSRGSAAFHADLVPGLAAGGRASLSPLTLEADSQGSLSASESQLSDSVLGWDSDSTAGRRGRLEAVSGEETPSLNGPESEGFLNSFCVDPESTLESWINTTSSLGSEVVLATLDVLAGLQRRVRNVDTSTPARRESHRDSHAARRLGKGGATTSNSTSTSASVLSTISGPTPGIGLSQTEALPSPLTGTEPPSTVRAKARLRASLLNKFPKAVIEQTLFAPVTVPFFRKLSFFLGVNFVCWNVLMLSRFPSLAPAIAAVVYCILFAIRVITYRRLAFQYFTLNFCYFVNTLTYVSIYCFPTNRLLAHVALALANGPVIWAVVQFRNSLVFHSLDKITTCFIHCQPPLVLFALKWLLTPEDQLRIYPAMATTATATSPDPSIPSYRSVTVYSMMFYLSWQFFYYIVIYKRRKHKLDSGARVDAYTWFLTKSGSRTRRAMMWPFGPKYTLHVYVLGQFIYTVITLLPHRLYFNSYRLHLALILILTQVAVWNGAVYYVDVFAKSYAKQVKTLAQAYETQAPDTQHSHQRHAHSTDRRDASYGRHRKRHWTAPAV